MKLSKTYQPNDYEPNIYALWESSGAFKPSGQGDPYSIVMPPPNANGNLHAGHALFVALQDILIRYYRMKGRDTIWIPGADHAGFETWVVFEQALTGQGKSRFDYSRDQLYQMTWDFVDENRGNMELQLRALGASCDWNHQIFTLDREVTDVVFTTFKKLWDDRLIYRGERIVNYCTYHDTSFADIEVEYKEEQGKLWYIDYPLVFPKAGQPKFITIATTRPETMLGDEAVAVNPDDPRYAKLVGQKLLLPLVEKEIPIIADSEVDFEFGTGALKITPAHDPTDFEIGQRHDLPITAVIGTDGLMKSPAPPEFINLTVEQAREQVVEQLDHQGLLRKIEDIKHQVPHCYKCGRVIQPLPKNQWFVSVKPLAERAKKAIRSGKIKFVPEQKGRELERYFDELRDWNISRQIAWGIPIPAFKRVEDETISGNTPEWIFDTRVDQTEIEVGGVKYIRDEDTFDTWFSSGQWPYIVTRGDLTRFYPSTVMETGVDILRPWVARMIMLGLYITDDVPFDEVYLHGLVNDEHNQKMSKSKGNVINPMGVVEQYGSDALRMGIIANRSAALSQAFSTSTVVAGRNFCNKLWNIARLTQLIIDDNPDQPQLEYDIASNWVACRLDQARRQIDKHLEEYRFAEAYDTLYHVVWNDVADWFLEAQKLHQNTSVLKQVLNVVLKLAHPFAPFVTEAIWQSLDTDDKSTTLLISQQWPEKLSYNSVKVKKFEQVKNLVSAVRNLTAELGGKKRVLYHNSEKLVEENCDVIKFLARLEDVVVASRSEEALRIPALAEEVWLAASASEIKAYRAALDKRLDDAKQQVALLEKRLKNPNYVKNAPKNLVEQSTAELAEQRATLKRLQVELKNQ
ncbi:MAG: valine--tRNA ligase [Candidatus Nomurabacteria bacterium]|jgi:valyl-tRNA synthetase|nr:valine--tRNA ligase [Candidatus Nomurabacteria bacterium]